MFKKLHAGTALIISILFSVCFCIGMYFDRGKAFLINYYFVFKFLILTLLVFIIVLGLYSAFNFIGKKATKSNTKGRKFSIYIFENCKGKIVWLILVMMWLPNYILYIPGCLTVDAINQIDQLATHHLTNHHPILTTLIEGPIILFAKKMGRLEFGVAIYITLLFLFSSFIISQGFRWMSKHQISYKIRWCALVFFSIYPLWSAYARTLVKDTLFYPVFYVFMLYFLDILIEEHQFFKKKYKVLQFFGISLLLCLLRHNGFYVAAFSIAGLLWFCKNNRRRVFMLFVGLVLFWNIYNGILPSLGIEPGGKQEMLSIPFQQTARYVKEHRKEISRKEKKVINNVLNYEIIGKNYDPNLSDPVKNTYKRNDEALGDYFKIWWKQFLKHPSTYIAATLNGTYGYYSYKDKIKNPCGYYEQPINYWNYDKYKISFVRTFHKGRDIYQNIIKNVYIDSIFKILTQPMLYNWFCLLVFSYFLQVKKLRKYWVAFVPFWISFLICLASPVNGDLRYMLPIMSSCFLYLSFLQERIQNG